MKDGEFLRIKFHQLGFVFDVYEDASLAVGYREFRLAAQCQRADYGPAGSIDSGDILTPVVHGEYPLSAGVIDDSVRIRSRPDGTESIEGFQIEDGDGVRTSITREAAAEIGSDGDAVHTLRVRNLPHHRTAVRIEHHNTASMRNVDAAGVAINRDIVPAFIASHCDGFAHVVSGEPLVWWGDSGS